MRHPARAIAAAAKCTSVMLLLASAAAPNAEPLREWLLWGPYAGLAGLEVLSPGVEQRLRPATGDTLTAWGVGHTTKGTWRAYTAPRARVDLNLPETFQQRPDVMNWSRGCAYAHTYLRVPEEQPARLSVRANWRATAWLNGRRVPAGDVVIRAGWNRLLLKAFFPAKWVNAAPGWWFEADLSTPDGQAVPNLEIALDDPDRDPAELGDRTSVRLRAGERWAPLFDRGEEVSLGLSIAHRNAEAQPVTRTLRVEVLDYDDRSVHQAEVPASYGGEQAASLHLELGKLPVGHYRVVGDLRSEAGVTTYLPPMSFAVVWGPVDASRDDAPRKLAGCDYWFLNSGQFAERLDWLHQIGLTMNVGSMASWWISGDLQDGQLPNAYRPFIDEGLAYSAKLGIELVGYLEGGWPVKALQKQPREHWLRQGLSEDRLVVWPWVPLPEFDTADYESIVRRYVFQTVSRYRDRLKVWKSYNEIDIAGKMPPERYARIARILYEELKRADPDATMIGASLVYTGADWCRRLFAETDFAQYHDVYDIHAHPMHPPQVGGDLGNGPNEGLRGLTARLEQGGPGKPVWYGEVSPPLAHAEGGQRQQAANVIKEAAFAAAEPRVANLAWLVPYGAGAYELCVSSPEHYPYPGAIATNLCNHLLDGRKVLPPLDLGEGVQQVRVTAPNGGETVVLWSDQAKEVALPATGRSVTVIDAVGRERDLAVTAGAVKLSLTSMPIFVRAQQFE